MKHPYLRRLSLLLFAMSLSGAEAKRHGLASPSQRSIYGLNESVQRVRNQRSRQFVVEVATGQAPEGNLGLLLGWLNQPVRGIELYAGFGVELTPSRNYTGTVRYMFNFEGYRPYVAVNYVFRDLYALGSFSHNAGLEAGYKWVLHRTYHLTLGAGVRRILHVGRDDDSPLNDPRIDTSLLTEQERKIGRWTPTFAVRFSRAF